MPIKSIRKDVAPNGLDKKIYLDGTHVICVKDDGNDVLDIALQIDENIWNLFNVQ